MGITVLKMSMPYHDRRMAHGHERADQICGPNIGLTLQANRQAVQDARRCLHWLEQQGYTKLGILGTSIGSSVGYITLVHDERIPACANASAEDAELGVALPLDPIEAAASGLDG